MKTRIALLLVVLAGAVGFGIGHFLSRVSSTSQSMTTSAPPEAAGTYVEEDRYGPGLLEMVKFEGSLYTYRGGVVDFWIEMESEGQTKTLFHHEGRPPTEGTPGLALGAQGHFAWGHGETDDDGWQNWAIRIEHGFHKSEEQASTAVSSPHLQVQVSTDQSTTNSMAYLSTSRIRVWRKEAGKGLPVSRRSKKTTANPLQPGKVMCLKESTYKKQQGNDTVEEYVIRVKCRLVPEVELLARKKQ